MFPLFAAFVMARYMEATGIYPDAFAELDAVTRQALAQKPSPLYVGVSPMAFECMRTYTFEEMSQKLAILLTAELSKENATRL